MLALVDGRPQQLDIKGSLQCFIDHRLDVIRRRAAFELTRSEERAHVVEGLLVALDHIDRVIELIRSSDAPRDAAARLQEELGLTERQAEAILAMRLARLTQLEARKLSDELAALRTRIEELRHLVGEDSARRELLRAELADLATRYGDDRRTEILDEGAPFPLPSGESGESLLVLLSHLGHVKALTVRSGGQAVDDDAMTRREGDFVKRAFVARGSTEVLLFTARGAVHSVQVRDLPRGTRSSRGRPLSDLVALEEGDRIVSAVPAPGFDAESYILFVTREGLVKRTLLSEYANVRTGGIRAIGLGEDDELMMAGLSSGALDVLLVTRDGLAIRFSEEEIRPMGRSARGVRGIAMEAGDGLVAALTPRRDSELLLVAGGRFGKRVPFTEIRRQGRAGKGVSLLPDRERTGRLAGALGVHPGDVGACEMESGAVVILAADSLPLKPRRGASTRIEALHASEGAVVALHPARGRVASRDLGDGVADPVDGRGRVGDTSEAELSPTSGPGALTVGPSSQGELAL